MSNENTAGAAGGSLLDEVVRDGARQLLAAAPQAEVTAYVEQFIGEADEQATGWWSATVTTPSGR